MTSDNTFAIASGRPGLVRQQALAAPPGPRFDDTLTNTAQAQNVDVAPTAMAILGLAAPANNEGRILGEAFIPGGLNAFVSQAPSARARGAGAPACTPATALRSATVRPRGRRGLTIRSAARVDVDVFQHSSGRRVLGNRRVARFRGRRGTIRWSGRRGGDGVYSVRLRSGGEERRLALRRVRGRFRATGAFDRAAACGVLASYKLERPVFGGRTNRALGITFRLATEARVTVEIRRGRRLVQRFRTTTRRAGVTHRLRLPSERLRRGTYEIRLTAVAAGAPRTVARLVSRRL
jgi:hypothetical protein